MTKLKLVADVAISGTKLALATAHCLILAVTERRHRKTWDQYFEANPADSYESIKTDIWN